MYTHTYKSDFKLLQLNVFVIQSAAQHAIKTYAHIIRPLAIYVRNKYKIARNKIDSNENVKRRNQNLSSYPITRQRDASNHTLNYYVSSAVSHGAQHSERSLCP